MTGAGISAESGIPTFREAQTGLWAQYDPLELATPQAFAAHPERVWNWYAWRRSLIAGSEPNAGHHALAQWDDLFDVFTLITQNVDGFHQLAGSRNLIELHGSIERIKCAAAGHAVDNWRELPGEPPACPRCDAFLRPDVVWFGESLPREALYGAVEAGRQADVFFSIGTSGVVEPAASLPIEAKRAGAVLVEINPEKTPLSGLADFVFQGQSGKILPALTRALIASRRS